MTSRIERAELDGMDFSEVSDGTRLDAVTPGAILRTEFMEPLNLSAGALAREIGVPTNRVTMIMRGERAITADTAIRLGKRLGTTPEFWMNLQVAHDLEAAKAEPLVAAMS